jgi:serine-type D-Ala-D-Ala carboxypeptidase/endopeptidase (penicillin-binding protein 4)
MKGSRVVVRFSADSKSAKRLWPRRLFLPALIGTLMLLGLPAALPAAGEQQVLSLLGPRDALVLADQDSRILLRKNDTTPLVPASTLKLLTALAVLDTLGRDHRFETHFYTGPGGAVKIKGFGDPLLISEVVADMALQVFHVARDGGIDIHGLFVDDAYFVKPIVIPGVTLSSEPYDAPVGAFCVNFNTVNYRVVDGTVLSAEPQTPLLPFAERLIRKKGVDRGGRIVFSHKNDVIALYGAHLFGHFLANLGVNIDRVGMAPVNPQTDTLMLVYRSPFALTALVKKMMAFSNNFIANQLVLAAGAKKYGAPGTLEKSVRLLKSYCREKLALKDMTLVEGSGISRQNRITALALLRVVSEFEPYHALLRHEDGEYFKTGTLNGVSSRVGYIQRPNGGLYRFVIIVNTPGRSAAGIRRALRGYLLQNGYP